MDKAKPRVAVIGAGTMGCGIAAGFVAQGCDVVLLLRDAARANACQASTLALAESLHCAQAPGVLSVHALDAFDAWAAVTLVIETIKEDLLLKQQLFAWLEARVPAAVAIGSNSSGFAISRIAQGLASRSRMFGMHYFMPAHQVPLVEVVLGADSDAALAQQVCAMFAAAGKKPVLVKRDIAGFLANRIQHALMREVLSLIDSGIASVEDIDIAVRYSFGFRYAACGPVLQKEISGWESMATAAREIYPTLSNTAVLAKCLEQRLTEGKFGMKTGEGFLKWTPESALAARADYSERLSAALRLLE